MKYSIVNVESVDKIMPAVVQEICLHDYNSEKITIIVPDKFSFACERQIMSMLGLECSFNINVVTMNRFCQSLIDDCLKTKILGMDGSCLLTYQAFKDSEDGLEFFKSGARDIQFASHIYNTIGQFKSSRIDCQELLDFKSNNVFLQQKINELGKIYSAYVDRSSGYVDSSDILTLGAIKVIDSKTCQDNHFIFAGFDDMTAQGYFFVESVVRVAKSVSVICYGSKNKNAYIYNHEMQDRLKKISHTLEINLEEKYYTDNDADLSKMITNQLFVLGAKKVALPQGINVSTYVARSVSEELDYVFRMVKHLILNGVKYNQIGVAIYDLEGLSGMVGSYIDKFELNAYIDCPTALIKTEVYKLVESALGFCVRKDSRALINVVANKYLNIEENEKEIIINYLKINDIYFEKTFEKYIKNENIKLILIKIIEKLNILTKNNNIYENILDFLINCDIENINNNLINYFENIGDFYSVKILSQAKDKLLKSLDTINTLSQPTTIEEWVEIMQVVCASIKIMPLPISLDTILVTEAKDMYESKDYLFVVNCDSNTAPHYSADAGVITDDEIMSLKMSHNLAPSISHINSLARFQLFNLAHLFNRSLFVSLHDINDSALSVLTKEFNAKFQLSINNESQNIKILKRSSFDNAYKNGDYRFILPTGKNDSAFFLTNNDYKNKYNPIYWVLRDKMSVNDAKDFTLGDTSHVFKNNSVSASQLETYFRCPFQHYMRYVLRAKEEQSASLQSFDVGNILHLVAENFYKYRDKTKAQIIDMSVNEYFGEDRHSQLLTDKNFALIEKVKKEALRFLEKCENIDALSDYENKYVEFSRFGDNGVKFDANGREIKLYGLVDRVDLSKDRFRIIDYKTGKRQTTHFKDLYYGEKVQLFLYGRAMQTALTKLMGKDYRCGGVFYMPVRSEFNKGKAKPHFEGVYTDQSDNILALDKSIVDDNDFKSDIIPISVAKSASRKSGEIVLENRQGKRGVSESKMNELLDYAVKVSQGAVSEIASGNIEPKPLVKVCESCPYCAVCRVHSRGILSRQANAKLDHNTSLGVDNE